MKLSQNYIYIYTYVQIEERRDIKSKNKTKQIIQDVREKKMPYCSWKLEGNEIKLLTLLKVMEIGVGGINLNLVIYCPLASNNYRITIMK